MFAHRQCMVVHNYKSYPNGYGVSEKWCNTHGHPIAESMIQCSFGVFEAQMIMHLNTLAQMIMGGRRWSVRAYKRPTLSRAN